MRTIVWDRTSDQIVEDVARRVPVKRIAVKRGDTARFAIIPAISGSRVALAEGTTLKCVARANYGGTVWSTIEPESFTETGTEEAQTIQYEFILPSNTDPINAAIGLGTGTELPLIRGLIEIETYVGGALESTAVVELVVDNDIVRGDEGIPTSGAPAYPSSSQVQVRSEKNVPGGYPGLGSDGKIDPSVLPATSLTSVTPVEDTAERLALVGLSDGALVVELHTLTTNDINWFLLIDEADPDLEASWIDVTPNPSLIGDIAGLQLALDSKLSIAATELTADAVRPAPNTNLLVEVNDTSWMFVGNYVAIVDDIYQVATVDSPTGATITRRVSDPATASAVYRLYGIGARLTPSGNPGPKGASGSDGADGGGVISTNDPQPLGASDPGSSGEVSDAGHIHPLPTPAVIGAIPASEKAAASGICELDGDAKVPAARLPISTMELKGVWDASTNAPPLADGVGNVGDSYRVGTGGARDLGSGSQTFVAGSFVIYCDDAIWRKSGGADMSGYAPLASAALTGIPTAPTAAAATNTTQLATTAFVQGELAPFAKGRLSIKTVSTTTYAVITGDAVNTILYFTNAAGCTVTMNTAVLSAGDSVLMRQRAAGQVTVAAGGGYTLNAEGALLKTKALHSTIILMADSGTEGTLEGNRG